MIVPSENSLYTLLKMPNLLWGSFKFAEDYFLDYDGSVELQVSCLEVVQYIATKESWYWCQRWHHKIAQPEVGI